MLPAPLPDLDGLDPEALKALLIAKHNESIEQHKQLRSNSQEIEHLKLVIEKYRRMIFGGRARSSLESSNSWSFVLKNSRRYRWQNRSLKMQLKHNRRIRRSLIPSRDHRVRGASLCPKIFLVK